MKIKANGSTIIVETVKMKCGHCGNEWEYRGYNKQPGIVIYYATCPNCHYKRNIEKERVG